MTRHSGGVQGSAGVTTSRRVFDLENDVKVAVDHEFGPEKVTIFLNGSKQEREMIVLALQGWLREVRWPK